MGDRTVGTRPGHNDDRLTGRTYAIPFEDVWQGALRVIGGRKRWTLDSADDQEGIIVTSVRALHSRFNSTVEICIGLDADGQTRVDASTGMPRAFTDMGMNARRINGFFRALDAEAPRENARRTGPAGGSGAAGAGGAAGAELANPRAT